MKKKWLFTGLVFVMMVLTAAAFADGYPESAHPYADNTTQEWKYTYPGEAEYIKVVFSEDTELDDRYGDYIRIIDAEGNEKEYRYHDLCGRSVYLRGNTFTLRLVSDEAVNYYGFRIVAVKAVMKEEYEAPHFSIDSDGILLKFEGETENLVIPDIIDGKTVTGIGYQAFIGNTRLKSVVLPDTVRMIDASAFEYCTSLASISIPKQLEKIGNCAFHHCESLQSVTIPDTVTSLGEWVFSQCYELTFAKLPEGCTELKSYLFNACYSLRSVVIPDSVTVIGEDAFAFCKSLTEIKIPESVTEIGDYAFTNCHSLESINLPPNLRTIGHNALEVCLSLESIRIPASVAEIGDSAFTFDNRLTEIEIDPGNTAFRNDHGGIIQLSEMKLISYPVGRTGDYSVPDGVKEIGYGVFMDCRGLTGITIPDSVCRIDQNAFRDCVSLMQVSIPDSVASLGAYAFNGCGSLHDVKLSAGLTEIGDNTFSGCSFEYIVIPDSVTRIGNYAFSGNARLRTVILPEKAPEMAENSFGGCGNLDLENPGEKPAEKEIKRSGTCGENATWTLDPDGVLTIRGTGYIYGTMNWTKEAVRRIIIEEGITEIGSVTFADFAHLEGVTIPSTVAVIGTNAFSGCSSLAEVVIPEGTVSLGRNVFYECFGLRRITLPDTLKEIGGELVGGSTYFESNPTYTITADYRSEAARQVSRLGNTFRSPGIPAKLIYTFDGEKETGLTVAAVDTEIQCFEFPDGVTGIAPYAFRGCDRLTEITIPGAVTEISEGVFADCGSLAAIAFGPEITAVGKFALARCGSLTDVTFLNDGARIEDSAFLMDRDDLCIFCRPDSAAETYAKQKGLRAAWLDAAGNRQHGLVNRGGRTWFYGENGRPESGWKAVDGSEYYFNPAALTNGTFVLKRNGITMQCTFDPEGRLVSLEAAAEDKPGDVNDDGTVDGRDAIRLMKYLAEEENPETGEPLMIQENNADVNGDGAVDEKDLLRLMRYLGGEDVELLAGAMYGNG